MDVYLRLNNRRLSHFLSVPYNGNIYYPSIIHCGRQKIQNQEDQNQKTHEHGVYHFILYLEGENEFYFNNKITPLSRGLLIFCSPGNRHNFHPLLRGSIEYIELTIEYISHEKRLELSFQDILGLLFNMSMENQIFYMMDEERIAHFQTLHSKLYYKLSGKNNSYETDLLLLDIFSYFVDLNCEKNLLTRNTEIIKGSRARQLKEIIHSRFPNKLNLNEISLEIGISKSYLIKKFREEFGTTPLNYDYQLRINAAADLIVSTNRTMEDIAQSLGFCDVFYFIRTFKKYKGVTPGKYK